MFIPKFSETFLKEKKNNYTVCIPVINEGQKIVNQLKKMYELGLNEIVDIVICDGGSTDGSLDFDFLKEVGVTALLVNKDVKRGLSFQLMTGYYFTEKNGYDGAVTIDGNGKDGLEAIPKFVEKLKEGYDLIQGSRYIEGGYEENTPKLRHYAIKLIHVPTINRLANFKYTDTTNGFRAHSVKVFKNKEIGIYRDIFETYSLIHYLTVIVPQLGFRVCELPVSRVYPEKGKVPTKISFLKGNSDLLLILYRLATKFYNTDFA